MNKLENMKTLRNRQSGLTSVEFAIVGLLAFIVLFGAMEMGRMLFTLNTLREATYRGARAAVICPVNQAKIKQAAIFDASSTGRAALPNLSAANIQVEYLDWNRNLVTSPEAEPGFTSIRYVRVQIINYSHDFILPGSNISFVTRSYPVTLPSESLGINKEAGGAIPC